MGMIGALVAAATLDGCSSDAKTSPTSTTGAESSTTAAPATSTADSTPTSGPTSTDASAGTEAFATSTTQAARSVSFAYAAPIDSARLQHLADTYNGTWNGNWGETTGDTGTLSATVTIDPASRHFAMQFSYTGPFLQGGAGAPEMIDVTIPDGPTPENQPVALGLTGDMNLNYEGGTTAAISAAALPGNADGLSADLALLGDTATASYTIKSPAGQTVLGAAIVGRNHTPDPVDLSSIAEQHLNASLQSGQYAADLLTPQEAAAAVGTPIDAMLPNGGNLRFGVGVATTNTRAPSTDGVLVIQITVYRCVDAATMAAFWPPFVQGLEPHVPGFGDDAIDYPLGLYVLAGNLAAVIQVVALGDTPLPIEAHDAQKNLALAMVPRMRTAP